MLTIADDDFPEPFDFLIPERISQNLEILQFTDGFKMPTEPIQTWYSPSSMDETDPPPAYSFIKNSPKIEFQTLKALIFDY